MEFKPFVRIPKFWYNCFTSNQQMYYMKREIDNLNERVDKLEKPTEEGQKDLTKTE